MYVLSISRPTPVWKKELRFLSDGLGVPNRKPEFGFWMSHEEIRFEASVAQLFFIFFAKIFCIPILKFFLEMQHGACTAQRHFEKS